MLYGGSFCELGLPVVKAYILSWFPKHKEHCYGRNKKITREHLSEKNIILELGTSFYILFHLIPFCSIRCMQPYLIPSTDSWKLDIIFNLDIIFSSWWLPKMVARLSMKLSGDVNSNSSFSRFPSKLEKICLFSYEKKIKELFSLRRKCVISLSF